MFYQAILQWLHVDWWVDFVYFTNLPFSPEIYAHLYKDNVTQRSVNVTDPIPGWLFGFWCTHFRELAPLINSVLVLHVVSSAK